MDKGVLIESYILLYTAFTEKVLVPCPKNASNNILASKNYRKFCIFHTFVQACRGVYIKCFHVHWERKRRDEQKPRNCSHL